MRRLLLSIPISMVLMFALLPLARAQVLGACGTKEANKPGQAVTVAPQAKGVEAGFTRVPLPGEQAPNFVLPALVGDAFKRIKLSDYDGKWRVVCFYPADFTFV